MGHVRTSYPGLVTEREKKKQGKKYTMSPHFYSRLPAPLPLLPPYGGVREI